MSSLRDFHAEQAEKPLLDHPLTETVSQLISIAQRELQTLRNIGKGQPNLEQQRRSYADAHYAVSSMESRLFADIIEIGIPLDPAEKQRYEQLNALKSLITCAGLPSYSAIANTHGATLENEEEVPQEIVHREPVPQETVPHDTAPQSPSEDYSYNGIFASQSQANGHLYTIREEPFLEEEVMQTTEVKSEEVELLSEDESSEESEWAPDESDKEMEDEDSEEDADDFDGEENEEEDGSEESEADEDWDTEVECDDDE